MSDSEDEITERQFKVRKIILFHKYRYTQYSFYQFVLNQIENVHYTFQQICLIGHSQVGKTSIVSRYTTDTFTKNCAATVGVEFYLKRTVLQGNRHVTLKVCLSWHFISITL